MATKTFPYSVIWQGEIVPANTPIEVEETTEETATEEATEEKPKASKKRGAK